MHRFAFPRGSPAAAGLLAAAIVAALAAVSSADDYSVAEGHGSLLAAVGCFWCGEQAFEQYAPGVVEVVSGYAGGTNDHPTYRDHPGHYEVVLVEYDPEKTSYEVLANYAYRNMDPLDGGGQFCDRGSSYYPALFYATEEERITAERVLTEILESSPDWGAEDIEAQILERPKFWTAEEYHQDYYLKNPANYGFYKKACKRSERLKEVWGEDTYECYHDEELSCFLEETDADLASNQTDAGGGGENSVPTVVNERGEVVAAETNAKNAPQETAGLMPRWAIVVVSVAGASLVVLGLALGLFAAKRGHPGKTNGAHAQTTAEHLG